MIFLYSGMIFLNLTMIVEELDFADKNEQSFSLNVLHISDLISIHSSKNFARQSI